MDNQLFFGVAIAAILSCLMSSNANAAGVFRCADADGNVSFQETACSFDLEQDQLDLKFKHARELAYAGDDQQFIRFMAENQLAGFQDSEGRSLLHLACSSPTIDACRWAVNQGESIDHRDLVGLNALHHAAMAGSTANVEYLLKVGLAIESLDKKGATVLHHSVMAGKIRVSMYLLEADANPNAVDLAGLTPLKLAVINADQESVRLLIRFAANPDQVDAEATAVDTAMEHGRTDMLSTLNPDIRKVVKLGREVSIPTPVDGWNCSTFSNILDPQVKVLVGDHLKAAGCYLHMSSVQALLGAADGRVAVFSLDWLGSAAASNDAQREFELTVERYHRAGKKLFVDDSRHIGSIQSAHPMGTGSRAIVADCAEMITTLSERLVVINFCHLGHGQADDRLLREIESRVVRWYDRLVALNP